MRNYQITPGTALTELLCQNRPQAIAWISGNDSNPQLGGRISFYQSVYGGVLVEAEVFGLPNITEPDSGTFYAMHIHEFGDCSDNFANTGLHYNPAQQIHPGHAGDMAPLLGNQGYAFSVFYDKRFSIPEILGKSVVIHEHGDDFMTQPSGNSGGKIGCGEIMRA